MSTVMIEAREWIRKNPGNYLHIGDPYESDEALEIIGKFYDAGAIKVEVTAEPDDSDDGEEERETLYITLPECIPEKLLEFIAGGDCRADECSIEEEHVLRLWWDNH